MKSDKASLKWQWWAATCGISFAVLYSVFWGICWCRILTWVSFLPTIALPFFTTGPVDWNKLITFWIGFTTFFVWLIPAGRYMAVEATRRSRLVAVYAPAGASALPQRVAAQ